ncbi:DUF1295 domain-containing protein [Nocardia sp. NPDC004151]|uniref:DUF1295 domain-containing protein n=1 Tax=Nocardia sp. NPDC004151 TaxID=3364304 RepID=UPI0036A59176
MRDVFHFVLGFLIVLTVVTFASGFGYTNPYGRFAKDGERFAVRGPWAWLLFENPQWWAFTVTFWLVVKDPQPPAVVLYALWQVHYLYRGLIYPLLRASTKGFPVYGIVFGMVFNAANGFVNGYAVADAQHLRDSGWFTDPRFLIGLVVAVAGWAINFHADRALIALRGDGFTGYRIPYGGAFRWVSSANYFGELVLWVGWALMSWTWAGLVFVLFTVANLLPRAVSTHRWYRERFEDYPSDRKAMIPYLI